MLFAWVDTLPMRPVFILDSFSKFLEGGDENSAKDVNEFWSKIDPLKRAGCSFIPIHHSGKKGEKGENYRPYRGSTAIEAGCDYMFEVENATQSGNGGMLSTIKMWRFKARNKQPFGDKNSVMFIDIDPGSGHFTIGEDPTLTAARVREAKKAAKTDKSKIHEAPKPNQADDVDVTDGMRTGPEEDDDGEALSL